MAPPNGTSSPPTPMETSPTDDNETTTTTKEKITTSSSSSTTPSNNIIQLTPAESETAIQNWIKLIQYPTVSATAPSDGSYTACATYIRDLLSSISVLDDVHFLKESPENCPVVVARWKGREEGLPVILLNSHYDVVPAKREDWSVEPFEGVRKDGRVYGRGTQDMKCVCIQYIEAIRKLHTLKPNFQPQRSIYLTFVPDEEIGGAGMAAFLSSSLYKSLPGIALALDEGLATTTNTYSVFYGERLPWWVDVTATGNTGHGSRFIDNTAVEQIVEIANKALAFRQGQREALHGSSSHADHSNCSHAVAAKKRRLEKQSKNLSMKLGDVTSLNITTLQAGVQVGDTYAYNCVPPVAKCSLDIRISPHVNPAEIGEMLDTWCRECSSDVENGHGVTWDMIPESGSTRDSQHALTSYDSKVNPWYGVFSSAMANMKLEFEPEVFPAATDSRFLRTLGIRALGFSPMRNTEIMLHEDDEYLEEDVFLEGVGVFVGLIEMLSLQDGKVDELANGFVDNGVTDGKSGASS